jgi:hypothetical protein
MTGVFGFGNKEMRRKCWRRIKDRKEIGWLNCDFIEKKGR